MGYPLGGRGAGDGASINAWARRPPPAPRHAFMHPPSSTACPPMGWDPLGASWSFPTASWTCWVILGPLLWVWTLNRPLRDPTLPDPTLSSPTLPEFPPTRPYFLRPARHKLSGLEIRNDDGSLTEYSLPDSRG